MGDAVEVFCDHEQDGERVRGWIKGVVVQVDNKLVAVQFRSNVFLTDGWMVPDRILWYSLTSDQIRSTGLAKKARPRGDPRILEYQGRTVRSSVHAMTYDVERIRPDFPILGREVRPGVRLVYLDSTATSQKPAA